ncbi:hypothetical protein [Mucilaginibacter sp.]|uniref:hypothetical protein n=1 Tax=Mucilaginibacter sp. TaxID=1882438 RepID=UPI00261F6873|nr:hypothetical protein [Mucilaginibacter sp.]MDB5030072.1 hypothetical protein [Mucilaginibacter sp.]
MKKISLILVVAGIVLAIQPVNAQTTDTSKNHIQIKKKVKTGVNGRKVTKIKIEGKGSPGAISDAATGAVTGNSPAPVVVTPAPVVAPTPPNPTVVIVRPEPEERPTQAPSTVTTITETKPAPVVTTSSTSTRKTTTATHVVHSANVNRPATHVYKKVYKKPAVASSTQTTTTTTIKKN